MSAPRASLLDLSAPPPLAEPVVTAAVSQALPLTAGELTISVEARFTPERVGLPSGTTSIALFGQLEPERKHPGSDYQACELGTYIVMRRVRLGRYRWLLSEIAVEPPCVTVAVERVAVPPKLAVPALATGEQHTFWLSTLGVDNLELDTRRVPAIHDFQDYVEITLWSYDQTIYKPWFAHLHARRILDGHDTVSWERRLEVGEVAQETARLGDHQLELLEVVWVNEGAPNDIHARFRLSRGTTADGMTLSPPPKPRIPWAPR